MLKRLPWWAWLFVSGLVVILDHATKLEIEAWFQVHSAPVVLTSWFNLVIAHNRGAAFSMLAEGTVLPRILFSIFAIVASIALIWLIKKNAHSSLQSLALALILGGALGNLWDRLSLGSVIDFIQWHWGEAYWPAFNLADSAITVGAVLLVVLSVFPGRAST